MVLILGLLHRHPDSVLGIVQVGRQSMADRYVYLPSIGPFFMAGLAVALLLSKTAMSRNWKPAVKTALVGLVSLVFAAMTYLTVMQQAYGEIV